MATQNWYQPLQPNTGAEFIRGLGNDYEQSLNNQQTRRMNEMKILGEQRKTQQEQAINELTNLAANGDQQAMQKLSMVAPERAKGVFDYQENQIKLQNQKITRAAQIAQSIEMSNPDFKQQSYEKGLAQFAKEHPDEDISYFPKTYNKQVSSYLQQMILEGRKVEDVAKEQFDRPLQEARTKTEGFQQRNYAANTAKTYADIDKTKVEIGNLKTGGGEKPPQGYRFTPTGDLEAIPGGPAGKQSAESAGKVALIKQGLSDVSAFEKQLKNKDGSFNRTKIAGMRTYGRVNARDEYSKLFNSLNARLRLESGAAVPPSEVKSAFEVFAPSPLDSDQTIESKINRMKDFFVTAEQEIGQGRGAKPTTPTSNINSDFQEGQTATNPQTGQKITFIGGKWQ